MKAKQFWTILLVMALLGISTTALAEIEVEDAEKLPPPMVVTYEPPPAVVVTIPSYTPAPMYQPVKETTTMPPLMPAPVPTPISTPASCTDEIKGDYRKGSVYGPNLSTRELEEVKTKVSEIASSCISNGMTDAQKIVALVNYVYDHCSYAPDWSKNRANTAWGLLVYGEAQCSGYARGMVALFDAVGVDSRYVHAAKDDPVNPSHQWNMVRLDGKWYHLDVQMFDSSYSGAVKPIVLMGSHLTYDDREYPAVNGDSQIIQ